MCLNTTVIYRENPIQHYCNLTISIFSTAGEKLTSGSSWKETCDGVFHANGDKRVEMLGQRPEDDVHHSLEQQLHPVG